jgi:hypothetical protein
MNVRDANWKQILSCDALDLSVVYATGSLSCRAGARGILGVEFMAWCLQQVALAGEKGIICAVGVVVAPVFSNSCA